MISDLVFFFIRPTYLTKQAGQEQQNGIKHEIEGKIRREKSTKKSGNLRI